MHQSPRIALRRSLPLLTLQLSLSLACVPPAASTASPRHPRSAPASLTCRIERGQASCGPVDGSAPPAPIPLDFPVIAHVARFSGGAFLLGPHGQLVRLTPQGTLSGAWSTPLHSLATTRDLLCGSDGSAVLCARDFREDSTCSTAADAPGPFVRLPLAGTHALASRHDARTLCAGDHPHAQCLELTPRCEAICLSFPACAPVRCADPCAPGTPLLGLTLKNVPPPAFFLQQHPATGRQTDDEVAATPAQRSHATRPGT